jgi:hypothetical protein
MHDPDTNPLIGGLIFGGLIFGWAYIWNEVSISTCGGLIHGGGGGYSRRFTVYNNIRQFVEDPNGQIKTRTRHKVPCNTTYNRLYNVNVQTDKK